MVKLDATWNTDYKPLGKIFYPCLEGCFFSEEAIDLNKYDVLFRNIQTRRATRDATAFVAGCRTFKIVM